MEGVKGLVVPDRGKALIILRGARQMSFLGTSKSLFRKLNWEPIGMNSLSETELVDGGPKHTTILGS